MSCEDSRTLRSLEAVQERRATEVGFCELFFWFLLSIVCPRLITLIRSESMNRNSRKSHSGFKKKKRRRSLRITLLVDN